MEGRGRSRGGRGERGGGGRGRSRGRPSADARQQIENATPRSINVAEFATARAQEVDLLTRAVTNISGNRRVFQTLPRHLRRRAMSHNINRLPVRLRVAAQMEMASAPPAGPKTTKRHRVYKRRPEYLVRNYVRRQRQFVWLETHIWHAKRMRMANLWGYKLAAHPSDKSARACFRASAHLATIHDASYYPCVELKGQEQDIIDLLTPMTDPSQPSPFSFRMFLSGNRASNAVLHHPFVFPFGAIAPVTFLWKPLGNASPQSHAASDEEKERQLWIWIHPAAFEELTYALKTNLNPERKVYIDSLEKQLVRFELTGAHAHTILRSVLDVASDSSGTGQSPGSQLWEGLTQLRSTASLPSGAVIALTVNDPRLSFPPLSINRVMRLPAEPNAQEDASKMGNLLAHWPDGTAQSPLWDKTERRRMIDSFCSDAEVVKRRQELSFQTSFATAPMKTTTRTDTPKYESSPFAKLEILLVQRPGGLKRGYGSGWDVVLPAGWARPFWKAFIFAGARAIGLRERRRFHNEQNVPHFPEDFPDTNAGRAYNDQTGEELRTKYYAKPPAKRSNFEKLKVPSPFQAAWHEVLGVTPENVEESIEESEVSTDGTAQQEGSSKQMDVDDSETAMATSSEEGQTQGQEDEEDSAPVIQPFYVLRGDSARAFRHDVKSRIIVHAKNSAKGGQWKKRFENPTTTKPHKEQEVVGVEDEEEFAKSALVEVLVQMAPRGIPEANAMICRPTASDIRRCNQHKKEDIYHVHEDEDPADSRDILGYITTGDYSFVKGGGKAIGFCSAVGVRRLSSSLVLLRNPSSPYYHPARIDIRP